jgi:hypothetical protein
MSMKLLEDEENISIHRSQEDRDNADIVSLRLDVCVPQRGKRFLSRNSCAFDTTQHKRLHKQHRGAACL